MAKLKERVQAALDEGRILILVTQVAIGFGYRAFFEEGFQHLQGWARALLLASLLALLVAFCLMCLPASYHRLVANGEDRDDVHRFTTGTLRWALLPLALGLGAQFAVASARAVSTVAALFIGCAATTGALGAWYLYPTRERRRRHRPEPEVDDMEPTQLSEKIRHVLTEARMVLPGAQALLGFQFAVTLVASFDALPYSMRLLHVANLALIGLAVVLLITPAAYHRIVERGDETEDLHRVASRFVVAAMVPLALGLCGDLAIVVFKVTGSLRAALGAAGAALAITFGLWFGLTGALRRRGRPAGARPRLRWAQSER